MKRHSVIGVLMALLLLSPASEGQNVKKDPPPAVYYEEDVAASNPGRTEQAGELEKYLAGLNSERASWHQLFKPDFSSPEAYLRSAERLRKALRDSLGYPPPGKPENEAPVFTKVGEDEVGIYYRARISVLPDVHAIGLFIVPKHAKGRVPLVIAMHGGGGSPEAALFHGGANYHDMVRGVVGHGYAAWVPQHLFQADGFPADIRQRKDSRARLAGTTITAIEITKITRSLDIVLKRPEVDPKRIAMIGLSYGGFYTQLTTALEPRINVAVASCWFGDRAELFTATEPTGWNDMRFTNGLTLFRDPEIAALICPRPLEIQLGDKDHLVEIESGRRTAPLAADYYKRLGKPQNFRFIEFQGGHEFYGPSCWDWLSMHL